MQRRRRRLVSEHLETRRVLTGSLHGQVFEDINGDGVQQAESGKRGLEDFRVFVDTNANGRWDQSTETLERPGNPVDLSEYGSRTVGFTVDAPGRYIADVDVRLTIDNFFTDSLRVQLTSPDGETVTIIDSPDADPRDVLLNDEARAEFLRLEDITGEMQPRNPLSQLDGHEPRGRWTLTVRQTNGFVAPTLESWSLVLTTTDEPFAHSAANGSLSFPELEAGEYGVHVAPPRLGT